VICGTASKNRYVGVENPEVRVSNSSQRRSHSVDPEEVFSLCRCSLPGGSGLSTELRSGFLLFRDNELGGKVGDQGSQRCSNGCLHLQIFQVSQMIFIIDQGGGSLFGGLLGNRSESWLGGLLERRSGSWLGLQQIFEI
jgi:hypothetical protein